MTSQIAVKLPSATVAAIDDLVRAGRFESRSQAVRAGIQHVIEEAKSNEIDQAFADGFDRMPETPDELRDAERLALEAIEDEPWEKWW